MKTLTFIFTAPLVMAVGSVLAEPDEGFDEQEGPFTRVVKHDDGSKSIFKKTPDLSGMLKTIYNAQGVKISVTYYRTGKYGELRSCLIFDGKKKELFYVRYGYDKNARLVEERMFDSATGHAVRRFLYTYDAMGNRSKPICITLVKDNANMLKYGDKTVPDEDPFARDFKKSTK